LIGLILAAGAGRRLHPLTSDLPKTLLAVDGDRTILDIALENLHSAGLNDIVIVTGVAGHHVKNRKSELERTHGVRLELLDNDRAEEWNNAYSLWLAREVFRAGAMLVNGDTVHPPSVEMRLLDAAVDDEAVLLAIDAEKSLGEEEMKVVLSPTGTLERIHKSADPSIADGEYIGVTLIGAGASAALADALEATWRHDPGLYYEDGFQEYADRGGRVGVVPIGTTGWVEVDNHDDLACARELLCHS
jgi:choline kinase